MTRTFLTMVKGVLCVAAIAGCVATVSGPGMDVDVYPPAAFIATATPAYYEGRPVYWWGNRWYYRDGAVWRAYREEPPYLRDYRAHRPPERKFYGRAHEGGYHRG